MKDRFADLWLRIGANTNWAAAFKQISDFYSQEDRFYHNLSHIHFCLDELDEVRNLTKRCDVVETAIWYHDVIYDVKKNDNEKQSAELALSICKKAGLADDFSQEVYELIMATRHKTKPAAFNEKLIIDIDLAILGTENDRFEQYEKGIRREYSFVEESEFRKARSQILQGFLERKTIFFTPYFIDKYESKARNNLKESIRKLTGNQSVEHGEPEFR